MHFYRITQSSPATRHGGAWGRGGIAPTHSRSRHQMGVSGQHHTPAAPCPGERTPGTHWTGGWVGLRAGLDTEAEFYGTVDTDILNYQTGCIGWYLQAPIQWIQRIDRPDDGGFPNTKQEC
jgi:hypothetical protein